LAREGAIDEKGNTEAKQEEGAEKRKEEEGKEEEETEEEEGVEETKVEEVQEGLASAPHVLSVGEVAKVSKTMNAFAANLSHTILTRKRSPTKKRYADGIPPTNVALKMLQIFSIDTIVQQFDSDFILICSWYDHHLISCKNLVYCDWSKEYYRPDFQFPNNVDLEMADTVKGLQPRKANRGPNFDGHVRMSQRYSGRMATTFELQHFPFDSQSLWVVANCRAWNKHEVRVQMMKEYCTHYTLYYHTLYYYTLYCYTLYYTLYCYTLYCYTLYYTRCGCRCQRRTRIWGWRGVHPLMASSSSRSWRASSR
jgi:hypothetical protein